MNKPYIHVLLVEDDEDDYLITAELLSDITRANYELEWVTAYQDALPLMTAEAHDVYLVDYRLGPHNGLDLIREAIEGGCNQPTILLTGQGGMDIDLEAMETGVADYLVKGKIDSQILDRSIRYAIERKRHEHTIRRRLDEKTLLSQITTEIASAVDLDTALLHVCRDLAKFLDVPQSGFVMVDHENKSAKVIADFTQDNSRSAVGYPIPIIENPSMEYILKHKKPLMIEDAENDPLLEPIQKMIKEWKIKSMLIVPVIVAKEILGTLGFDSFTQRAFDQQEIETIQNVASQIGLLLLRKQAEEALHGSQQFLQNVFGAIQDGISVLDTEFNVIMTNHWMEQMYSKQMPLVGQKCYQVYQQRQSPCPWCPSHKTLETGESHTEIVPYISEDVQKGWIELSAFPAKDEQGNVTNIIEYVKDITERKQAENTLNRQLNELHLLQEVSSFCLESMDEDEIISHVTKAIGDAFYPNHFGVMLLEDADDVLKIHPSYQGIAQQDYDELIPLGEGVAGKVAKANKSQRIDDVSLVEHYIPPIGADTRSELCVPISNGRVFGVINAESGDVGAFSMNDERLLATVADQLAMAIERLRLFQSEKQRRLEAEAQREASAFLTMSLDWEDVLNSILDSLRKVIKCHQASIHLFEEEVIHIVAGNGFKNPKDVIGHQYSFRNQLAKEIMGSKSTLILSDASKDPRFENFGFVNTRGWMGVPLVEKGEVFGILTVDNAKPDVYNEQHATQIQIFANNAAAAIVKARLFENLQTSNEELTQSYDSTIEGWAKTMELRDQETQGHSERVTEMTLKLARTLGLSEPELIHVRRGAVLHDVGKIGIPDSILQKPGKLNEEEWAVMRQHPTLAYNVLSSSNFLEKALDIPYCHHEKWDGSGYPRGLKEEEIPLAARAFAIIDAYDALRSDRPYRKAWTKEKVLDYIKEQSGSHFDPNVVDNFLKLLDENPEFDVYNGKTIKS